MFKLQVTSNTIGILFGHWALLGRTSFGIAGDGENHHLCCSVPMMPMAG
jgi:hypothetical protein